MMSLLDSMMFLCGCADEDEFIDYWTYYDECSFQNGCIRVGALMRMNLLIIGLIMTNARPKMDVFGWVR
jgi:hypothetical protein